MFADESNNPLVPVSFMGTEKGKDASPITPDQVETHVLMMFSLLSKCHSMKKEMFSGANDEDIQSLQRLFDSISAHLNATFKDFAKQAKLIEDMKTNLDSARARCIHLYTQVWETNREVSSLRRNITPPWMETYQTATAKHKATMKESDIWNQCSKSKALIERTIGKDAMFIALRGEKRERGRLKSFS